MDVLKQKWIFQRKVEKILPNLILVTLKNDALSNNEIYDALKEKLTLIIEEGDLKIKYCPISAQSISWVTSDLKRKNILKSTNIYKDTRKAPIKKLYSII